MVFIDGLWIRYQFYFFGCLSQIDGKRGFANRRHIQETRIFKSQLDHRATEGNGSTNESIEPSNYVIEKSVEQNVPSAVDTNNQDSIESKPSENLPEIRQNDIDIKEKENLSDGDQKTESGKLAWLKFDNNITYSYDY